MWSQNIQEFLDVLRDLGDRYDVPVISPAAWFDDDVWTKYSYDGVHLNPQGHEVAGRHMAETISQLGVL
jgi:lysophospholipase L1-like esterase